MTNDLRSSGGGRALTLAFLTAIIGGFDLQSAGVAPLKLARVFELIPGQLRLFFSSVTIGLIFGAMADGLIADKWGRRAGLALSLAVFSLFSFGAAAAGSTEQLIVMRLLTGIGLGSALPNLVAIAAESARHRRRGRAMSIVYAGVPIGGAVASALSMLEVHDGWRMIFIVGGALPLAMIPALLMLLPPPKVAAHASELAQGRWRRLFSPGSLVSTLLLRVGFFIDLLVVYLLLNWLPALLVSRGFDRFDAALAQIAFNLCVSLGSVVGGLLLDVRHRAAAIAAWSGYVVAEVIGLGVAPLQTAITILAAGAVGAAILGPQAIFYGVAPQGNPADVLIALIPITISSSIACVALVARGVGAAAPAGAPGQ